MLSRWWRRQAPAPSDEHRTIELDYPVRPRVRWGHGQPPHPRLYEILDANRERFASHLHGFVERHAERLSALPLHATTPSEPHWANGSLPAADVIALYGFVSDAAPALYLEVGSGNSTKIARLAVTDHGLPTRIVSLDPEPRVEIDALCDETIREPVENVSLSTFDRLMPGDILFYDGSHRCLQNSDVTVMLLDVLPRLPAGVLVHFHDIVLPDDYAEIWLGRFYNEQYVLAAFLLGGHAGFDVELANWFCRFDPELNAILQPIYTAAGIDQNERFGSSFWIRTR